MCICMSVCVCMCAISSDAMDAIRTILVSLFTLLNKLCGVKYLITKLLPFYCVTVTKMVNIVCLDLQTSHSSFVRV